jgi:hypothetical protein
VKAALSEPAYPVRGNKNRTASGTNQRPYYMVVVIISAYGATTPWLMAPSSCPSHSSAFDLAGRQSF